MAETWTHLRVRQETRSRLGKFIESLRTAAEQGKIETPYLHTVDITADDAVRILLDREDDKRRRKQESRERLKKAREANFAEVPEDEE